MQLHWLLVIIRKIFQKTYKLSSVMYFSINLSLFIIGQSYEQFLKNQKVTNFNIFCKIMSIVNLIFILQPVYYHLWLYRLISCFDTKISRNKVFLTSNENWYFHFHFVKDGEVFSESKNNCSIIIIASKEISFIHIISCNPDFIYF